MPQFTGVNNMTDALALDAAPAPSSAEALSRRVILFGPATIYQGALKCLIENRVTKTDVVQVEDEQSLLAADGNLIISDVDIERITEAELAKLTATLQKVAPRPVLLITGGVHPSVLQQLLRDGVAGVVMRSSSCEMLLEAVESVASGKVWLQRDLLAETFGESSHVRRSCSESQRIAQLTQREREIIAIASCGLTNRQVANKVHISEATVRHHLSSVFTKLGVANRGELIIFAYRHGLADEADRQRLC